MYLLNDFVRFVVELIWNWILWLALILRSFWPLNCLLNQLFAIFICGGWSCLSCLLAKLKVCWVISCLVSCEEKIEVSLGCPDGCFYDWFLCLSKLILLIMVWFLFWRSCYCCHVDGGKHCVLDLLEF